MKRALKEKIKSAQRMKQRLESKGFLRVFEGAGRIIGGIFISLVFAAFVLVEIEAIAPNATLISDLMSSATDTLSKVGQLVILGFVMLLAKLYRDRRA